MFILPAVCTELGMGISSEEMAGVCPVLRQTKAQEMRGGLLSGGAKALESRAVGAES